MSVENISAGLAGVARTTAQRPTKNALISNTDNSAVQQYAQVSRFTGYLDDAPIEPAEQQQQQYSQSSSQQGSGSSYSSSSGNRGNGEAPPPVLNYGRNGSTTPLEKPNTVGQFLSVVA